MLFKYLQGWALEAEVGLKVGGTGAQRLTGAESGGVELLTGPEQLQVGNTGKME